MLLMNCVGISNKLAAIAGMPNTTAMSITPPCKFRHIQYTYSQHFASRRSEACCACQNVPKARRLAANLRVVWLFASFFGEVEMMT